MNPIKLGSSLTAALVAAVLVSGVPALAAGGAGYSISPFIENLEIGQNQPTARYAVTITNNTAQTEEFKLTTQNFGSLNASGGLAFLGTSTSQFAQKHGLATWMSLDQTGVTVPAGGNVQVGVTINNSSQMSFGGHYGAVLATAQTAPTGSVNGSRVGVIEVLSALVLLVKEGGPPPDLVLVSQKVPPGLGALPAVETDSFSNVGDIHVVPRGVTEMYDPFGRPVMSGALNVNSSTILPGMVRTYSTPLMRLASAWMPGTYKLVTNYRYDGTENTKQFVSYFWYSGSSLLWAIVAIVLIWLAGGLWALRRWPPKLPKFTAGMSRK